MSAEDVVIAIAQAAVISRNRPYKCLVFVRRASLRFVLTTLYIERSSTRPVESRLRKIRIKKEKVRKKNRLLQVSSSRGAVLSQDVAQQVVHKTILLLRKHTFQWR